MESTFNIDNDQYTVNLSRSGVMKYFCNGELFKKSFSWHLKDETIHKTNNNEVKIITSIESVQVYKDGQLYINDLIPEVRQTFKTFSYKRLIKLISWALLFNISVWALMIFFK